MVAEIRPAGVTTMIFDGLRVLEEWRAGVIVAQHVYGPAEERPVQTSRPLRDAWTHEDSLGTPRLLTDAAGGVIGRAAYDVWGNRIAGSGVPVVPGYGGRRYDPEAAAYDLRARMYSPGLGRFLQRDPKGVSAASNPYAYALNSPARYVDLLGLEPSEASKAVQRFAGGAAGALLNIYGMIEMGVISWLDMFGVPINDEARAKKAGAGEWFQSLYGAIDEHRFIDWVGEGLNERSEHLQALEAQGKHFDAAVVFGDTAMNTYAIGRGAYDVARGGISFGLEVRNYGFLEASKGLGYSLRYWATRYKEPTTWGGLGGVGEVRTEIGRGSPYENWATYAAHREIGQAVFRAEQAIRNGDAANHPAVQRYLQFRGTKLERAFYGTAVNRLVLQHAGQQRRSDSQQPSDPAGRLRRQCLGPFDVPRLPHRRWKPERHRHHHAGTGRQGAQVSGRRGHGAAHRNRTDAVRPAAAASCGPAQRPVLERRSAGLLLTGAPRQDAYHEGGFRPAQPGPAIRCRVAGRCSVS